MENRKKILITLRSSMQQHKDHAIECDCYWTVRKLKNVIKTTHAAEPDVNHQRLIYRGKYMLDNELIHEIIEASSIPQIVHLVMLPPEDQEPSSTNKPQASRPVSEESESSTLRQRRPAASTATTAATPSSTQQQTQQWHQQQWTAEQLSSYYQQMGYALPYDATQHHPYYSPHYYQHMWQEYHRVASYMHLYQQQQQVGELPAAAARVVDPAEPAVVENVANIAAQHQQQRVADNQPPPANPAMAAGPGGFAAGADDDVAQRDWLDVFFSFIRGSFFLGVVYMYSTIWRFLFIASCALLVYFYQRGFFQAQRRPPHPDEVERLARLRQGEGGRRASTDPNNNHGDASADNDQVAAEAVPPPPPPSIFATACCFVRTFFTSLIPQAPPGVVN